MADPQSLYYYDLRNLKKIPKLLRQLQKAGSDPKKPLKRWGTYMLGQTGSLFQQGKRGPVKWRPLAEVTKVMRRYRKRGSGRTGPLRILQDTGHLKRSIKTVTFMHRGTKAQIVFTRDPKAKTHQKGGTMKIPKRVITPKKPGGVLVFQAGGETVFARKVVQPAKVKKVPERKILFILAKDKRKAVDLLQGHANDVAGKFGKT